MAKRLLKIDYDTKNAQFYMHCVDCNEDGPARATKHLAAIDARDHKIGNPGHVVKIYADEVRKGIINFDDNELNQFLARKPKNK